VPWILPNGIRYYSGTLDALLFGIGLAGLLIASGESERSLMSER
jgi:hypothetical protein